MPASKPRSRFITFEGGEGAGKSTQARKLVEALRATGAEVVLTREPGGSPGAEDIRRLLVEGETGRWTPPTEALLHFAARSDHIARVIAPALAKGGWVISDRFADSTMVYQGYGQGLDLAWLNALRKSVVGATEPGLTFVFDLPVETGLKRAQADQRYERMGLDFHQRLRAGFKAIAAADPERCVTIDADRPIDAIQSDLRAAIASRYGVRF
jgi:dTMP kinase